MINSIITREDISVLSKDIHNANLADGELITIALGVMDQGFITFYDMETTGRKLLDFILMLKLSIEKHMDDHFSELVVEHFGNMQEALDAIMDGLEYDEPDDIMWAEVEVLFFRKDDYMDFKSEFAAY